MKVASPSLKILLSLIFGVFFAICESVVVIYLRQALSHASLSPTPVFPQNSTFLSLGFITFLKPTLSSLIVPGFNLLRFELLREFATIVLILTFVWNFSSRVSLRLAYFILTFAVWDLFYYFFLRLFIGWPISFFDQDVFFLIPVAWIGPVLTPIIISVIILIISLVYILTQSK